jgi:hypothetical protein
MTATSAPEEDNLAQAQGRSSWEGSEVTPADISWITTTRRVERGFALPATNFFQDFLDTYGLQPHHLLANVVMILSAFAAFYEGYAGIEPFA